MLQNACLIFFVISYCHINRDENITDTNLYLEGSINLRVQSYLSNRLNQLNLYVQGSEYEKLKNVVNIFVFEDIHRAYFFLQIVLWADKIQ